MAAWNGWYHVNGNTYGTWLPGDPRGWREKRHRKHVTGDYKDPPPAGYGDGLHVYAHSVLKGPPVHLDHTQRGIAGRALVEMLVDQDIQIIIFALSEVHYHLLARFSDNKVKPRVGRAKKHAYHELRAQGFEGKLWQRGCNVVPIRNRQHQLNVFAHIGRHVNQGAWVWTFREGLYWRAGEEVADSRPDHENRDREDQDWERAR